MYWFTDVYVPVAYSYLLLVMPRVAAMVHAELTGACLE